ncbi:nucleotidyl transferase AbiEii/AbiGii toxin family protein [Roseateles sp. MS654]|uniref:nucleotidyl transferase AbiEii/AbiGii toxin family protein n=1 Tax=Roseateles sp. MS654 TaxID=3412685 RepID=UPI003C2E97DC
MFERPHHRHIAAVLKHLNTDLLRENRCLFGGGTAIALAFGEYRESVDIDFMCDDRDGYRTMRSLVDQSGLAWAFSSEVKMEREPRVDQYGIRTAVSVGGERPIKLEIVYEGRITLDAPRPEDKVCGVWRLTDVDLVASKLMANADRWPDDSVMSRDLIDLAMMAAGPAVVAAGRAKAELAYGTSIASCFAKAKAALLERPNRLKTCLRAMGMTATEDEVKAAVARFDIEPPAPRRRRRASV